MPLRKLTADEERFLQFMISRASLKLPSDWKQTMMVKPMDDGKMGSLLLFPQGTEVPKRDFGSTVFEYQFKDSDKIDVLASLNLDQHGALFELDVWKFNFDPLIKFPDDV